VSDNKPYPNHFLLRRLHSLTGVVPIGVFLISHLLTNSSVVWGSFDSRAKEHGHAGVATFQHEVNFIHSLPFLLLIEVFGLWLPIAFHSALGVVYAMSGKPNVGRKARVSAGQYTPSSARQRSETARRVPRSGEAGSTSMSWTVELAARDAPGSAGSDAGSIAPSNRSHPAATGENPCTSGSIAAT
jgi:succinate dehydrogenase/fumarate reductase cytochrome b subunit